MVSARWLSAVSPLIGQNSFLEEQTKVAIDKSTERIDSALQFLYHHGMTWGKIC